MMMNTTGYFSDHDMLHTHSNHASTLSFCNTSIYNLDDLYYTLFCHQHHYLPTLTRQQITLCYSFHCLLDTYTLLPLSDGASPSVIQHSFYTSNITSADSASILHPFSYLSFSTLNPDASHFHSNICFLPSSTTSCRYYQQYLPQLFHSISFFQIISSLPTTAPHLFAIHTSTTIYAASNFNSNIPALCFSTSSVKLAININPLPLFQKSCNIFFPSKYCHCFQATSVCQNNFTSLSSITQLFFAFYHHFLLLSSMTTALLPSVFSPIIHKPTNTMQLVSLSTLPLHLFLPLVQAKHHLIPASLMLPKSHTFSSHPTSTSSFLPFFSHPITNNLPIPTTPFLSSACFYFSAFIHCLSFSMSFILIFYTSIISTFNIL
jgi:hypothetical protein